MAPLVLPNTFLTGRLFFAERIPFVSKRPFRALWQGRYFVGGGGDYVNWWGPRPAKLWGPRPGDILHQYFLRSYTHVDDPVVSFDW